MTVAADHDEPWVSRLVKPCKLNELCQVLFLVKSLVAKFSFALPAKADENYDVLVSLKSTLDLLLDPCKLVGTKQIFALV